MDRVVISKIQNQMRKALGSKNIKVEGRENKLDSADVTKDGEFLGVVFEDKLFPKTNSFIEVEGGQKLNASLIDQKMADELYWFIAPKLLNDQNSISMLGIDKPNHLDNAYHLELVDVQKNTSLPDKVNFKDLIVGFDFIFDGISGPEKYIGNGTLITDDGWVLSAAHLFVDEENLFFKIAELLKIKRSQANQIKQSNY